MQNKLRLEIGSVNLNIKEILEKSKLNKENLYYDEPMAKHTSFKIGGPADVFIKVDNIEELKETLDLSKKNQIPLTIIGNGSNLLVTDKGIRGITAKLNLKDIEIKNENNKQIIKVEAGVPVGLLAQKLLKEAGYEDTDNDGYVDKDGQKLSINWLTYPTRLEQPKLAEYAQATLKDIGIDVVVNNTSDHMTIAKSGDFDVYVSSTTTAPTGDPEYFFTSTVTGAKNYGNYQNEEVTKLTDQLHQSFDKDERAKLAVELQQDILDDDAFFFVSHLNMGIVTKSNVTGMAAHPCDYYEITADLDVE